MQLAEVKQLAKAVQRRRWAASCKPTGTSYSYQCIVGFGWYCWSATINIVDLPECCLASLLELLWKRVRTTMSQAREADPILIYGGMIQESAWDRLHGVVLE